MSAGRVFGRAARIVARTSLGRRAGVWAYRATAELAARRLVAIPGVRSVYLTGSLAHGDRLDPGQSDIDLVAACDFDSVTAELAITERLRHFQRRTSILGGLFYNLDCLDVREVPFARAFGGAWEMRLDAHGTCLAGEPLWTTPVRRPDAEIRQEQLGMALRRWINTGARLLDPRVSSRDPDTLRSARRLVADLAERWSGCTLNSTGFERRADEARLTSALEVARRGVGACGPSDVTTLLVPAALEILDTFAASVTSAFHGDFQVSHADGAHGEASAVDRAPSNTPIAELDALGKEMVGPPFDTFVLLRKGVLARDSIPVVLASTGSSPRDVAREFASRLGRAVGPLAALDGKCRRPVLMTTALWSALPLVEPAPFVGALAERPLFCVGRAPLPLHAPDEAGTRALLRARLVERFTLCRGPELRPKMHPDRVREALAERFAILPALDRALDAQSLGLAPTVMDVSSAERRAQALQEWSARHRAALKLALAERLNAKYP